MALQKVQFLPGFNKQITDTQAEGQWVDGDNVRFRYGTPEKIGGWQQLGNNKITGAARAMHHIVNRSGQKYSIIGTNRILYAYSGGVFYDIHPIRETNTLTSAFTTTNGSAVVTITFSSGRVVGDILTAEIMSPGFRSPLHNQKNEKATHTAFASPSTLNTDVFVPSDENVMLIGPITVNGDVTVDLSLIHI